MAAEGVPAAALVVAGMVRMTGKTARTDRRTV
jgi:hypothetical protein